MIICLLCPLLCGLFFFWKGAKGELSYKAKKKIAEPVKQEVPVEVPVEKELVDDLELIAVITAAIAASEGKDPRQYIVRSIKKVHRNQW